MRNFLKILFILLSAVLVFGVAKFLDGGSVFAPEAPTEQAAPVSPATMPADTAPALTEAAEAPRETAAQTEPAPTEPEVREYTLTFAGNCTLGSTLSQSYHEHGFVKIVGEDYGYPFRNVEDYFAGDDFTFLNLEGPLTDESGYFTNQQQFSGPADYVKILTQSSVESVSLANDHILDYSDAGYASTTENLKQAGIHYAEDRTAACYTTDSGLTIGIYSLLCVARDVDTAGVVEDITALREEADIVVFAPHWGTVGNYLATGTQTELAHAAIDAGADIVVGTHPSVLQPMEEYNGGLIFYSLGNFCVGSQLNPADYDTALIQLRVIREEDGTVRPGEATVVPLSLSSDDRSNNFQPTPYPESHPGYASTISKLSGTYHLRSIP